MSDRDGVLSRLRRALSRSARTVRHVAGRGRSHFERVEQTPYRVTVSGVRGKSTVVRWLNEALVARDLETYAKVTGNQAFSYRNRSEHEISRSGPTRLYENERELRTYAPVDAIVAENQGIREYTTRLANELFDPQVVLLLNVRRDHQSTLGAELTDIARLFTRTIPEDAHVISGDRNDAINEYLGREFEKTGHTFTVAKPRPDSPFEDVFGARSALLVDEALRALDLEPLPPSRIESLVTELRSEWGWQRLDGGGLVSNGAMMNDIESTELLRQFLVNRLDGTTITPFMYTRRDRAGRTAAFVHYLTWLAENGLIGPVHVAGSHAELLERRVDAEFVHHPESEPPERVLDACLAEGYPVYLMGNTVAEFMRELTAEIDRRTVG
ncbi:capsular biosynthesis protein CapB / polyglutamate synthase [Halorubrum saccharovorum DSM 1137]|uniref:Capsular biosynthesis protein CapB / polyglutamate synthase n=1 Tax=Halorubrum saccharovorum DSM 1137 TaxID=1227484 RepID=M0DNJ1_9EURY|nr:hypothetical protein [Halorubrum saccharovorum]ELZ36287.1 capsular biosynthesis protein CapB / polyglutamate synthase [Halorubrum saccharovorum DSM 1137]